VKFKCRDEPKSKMKSKKKLEKVDAEDKEIGSLMFNVWANYNSTQ